jgi:MFS family permease
VISRAIARDLYSGRALMIFFSRLLLVAGLAPVIAPILGGQLSRIMSWRGIFGVLAGFGTVLLLAGWFGLKETLPPERRIVGGFRHTLQGYNRLLHDRFFGVRFGPDLSDRKRAGDGRLSGLGRYRILTAGLEPIRLRSGGGTVCRHRR